MDTRLSDLIKSYLSKSVTQGSATAEISGFTLPPDSQVNEIETDSSFIEENKKDRELNREQRGKIAKKIFLLMAWEIIITGIFLFIILIIPIINAVEPQKISINIPPILYSLSLIIVYIFTYRYLTLLPDIRVTINKSFIRLKKFSISTANITKVALFTLIVYLINIEPRLSYVFQYKTIQTPEVIINLVLYTSLAVFTKTAYLGHYIIKALYDLMKNHKLN